MRCRRRRKVVLRLPCVQECSFMMNRTKFGTLLAAAIVSASSSLAGAAVETYESLSEGFLGSTFTHNGVTYRDVNNVSGFYADGTPFGPTDNGDQSIIE